MLSISSDISVNGTVKFCPTHVRMNPINQSINQSISQSIDRSINQSVKQSINQSINLGIFPDDRKCARATPFFKQGDRDDLNSYRPISVISVVAKAMKELSMINYMPI